MPAIASKTAFRSLLLTLVTAVTLILPLSAQSDQGKGSSILVKNGESICFLGDSITQAGANRPHGYCRLVISGLKTQGIDAKMVPAGISGHKSNQMLARLQRDVLDKKPDWMTLSCGVNDVWHGKRGVSLPDYRKNITAIVERARAAGIKVMILTSTMIKEDQSLPLNQQLVAYNEFLRRLAREKECILADLNARMQASLDRSDTKPSGNQLTSDGVHMNPLGNMMMASGVLEAFGFDAKKLSQAHAAWESTPGTCNVRVNVKMSAGEYRRLRALAAAEGISIDRLFQKAVEEKKRAPRRQIVRAWWHSCEMEFLTPTQFVELRLDLENLRVALEVQRDRVEESASPVDLDQPIGRLSRMDALQNQQMAEENRRACTAKLDEVLHALRVMDTGGYGLCEKCEAPVGYVRLKTVPEARACLPCAESA